MIVVVDGDAMINHVPLIFQEDGNKLIGHVARANPVWKHLENRSVTGPRIATGTSGTFLHGERAEADE
jgi:predicted FMN-binding regulatory protein PaiB